MLKGALYGAIAGLTAGASLCHAMAYPVGNKYHTYHGRPSPPSRRRVRSIQRRKRSRPLRGHRGDARCEYGRVGTRAAADRAREEFVALQRDLNVLPSGLHELAGVTEDEIDWLAEQTVDTQQRLLRCNPRPVTKRRRRGNLPRLATQLGVVYWRKPELLSDLIGRPRVPSRGRPRPAAIERTRSSRWSPPRSRATPFRSGTVARRAGGRDRGRSSR